MANRDLKVDAAPPPRVGAPGAAEIDAATGQPGDPEYEWLRTTLLEATAKLVAAGGIDAATRGLVEEFFSASGTVVTSVSLVAAGGRKPS